MRSACATRTGPWVLGVHIADPSPYIHRGSLLDDEAYGRGTTIYLPDQKYAMFPQALSEDLLSLRENQPRPVLSFYFRFATPDAEPDPPRLLKERLVVRHNLRYDEVDRMIEAGPAGLPGNEAPGDARAELALRVQQVARLAETFRAIRIAAGALLVSPARTENRGGRGGRGPPDRAGRGQPGPPHGERDDDPGQPDRRRVPSRPRGPGHLPRPSTRPANPSSWTKPTTRWRFAARCARW